MRILISPEATGTKYNTSEKGLRALYPDYLADLVEELLEGYPGIEMNTREAWDWLREGKGYDISRASVIIGMQALEGDGVLAVRDVTGKGGHHGVYRAALDREAFNRLINQRVVAHLLENFSVA